MKVITGPVNENAPHLKVVYITDEAITLALLTPALKGESSSTVQSWGEFVSWLKAPLSSEELGGMPLLPYIRPLVENVPGYDHGFLLSGRISLSLSGTFGLDEIGDCSIMDFHYGRQARPVGVYARLAQSKDIKSTYPPRTRALIASQGCSKAMTVVFPFAPTTTADAALIEVPFGEYQPILLDGSWDEVRQATAASSRLMDSLWSVQFPENVTVGPDEVVTLTGQLVWKDNVDFSWTGGDLCERSVELTLTTSAGYLPKTKIKTDINGQLSFKFRSTDLEPGDKIKIKAASGFISKVGSMEITVV